MSDIKQYKEVIKYIFTMIKKQVDTIEEVIESLKHILTSNLEDILDEYIEAFNQ